MGVRACRMQPPARGREACAPPPPRRPGDGPVRPPRHSASKPGRGRPLPTSWATARRRPSLAAPLGRRDRRPRPRSAARARLRRTAPRRRPQPDAPTAAAGRGARRGAERPRRRPASGSARRRVDGKRLEASREEVPCGAAHFAGTGPSTASSTASRTGGASRQLGIPSSTSATGYLLSWISAQWE